MHDSRENELILFRCGVRGHLARFACAYMEVNSKPGYQKDIITQLEEERKDFFAEWNKFLVDVVEPYLQRERTLLVSPRIFCDLMPISIVIFMIFREG